MATPGMPVVSPVWRESVWELREPYAFDWATIPEGFRWDGTSVPRVVWTPTGITPHDARTLRASLAHDFAYRYRILSREEADRVFLELLIEDGVFPMVAHVMYRGVRFGGSRFYGQA